MYKCSLSVFALCSHSFSPLFLRSVYNIWAQIDNGRGIAPQARFGHSAVVVHDDGLLIFGGNVNNGTSVTNDMWVYRGTCMSGCV